MLLRASGDREEKKFNLHSITNSAVLSGVAHGELLRELTEATVLSQWEDLQEIRERASKILGHQTLADILTVASGFNGITRVADSTGIPLDKTTAKTTFDLRKTTGIENFNYSNKSNRYDIETDSLTL